MAALDRATFITTWADSQGTFKENTTREVGEVDLQQFAQDIVDTFAIGSTANVLSTQVFSIGGWALSNGGNASNKIIYLGPSSNVESCKYFGVTINTDPDEVFPGLHRLPVIVPVSNATNPRVEAYHSSILASGASAIINIISPSGSLFSNLASFDDSVSNRGKVTLFF